MQQEPTRNDKKQERTLSEPGRTPGQAEGTRSAADMEKMVQEPGRTSGQAEGESQSDPNYEQQRRAVRQSLGNGSHDHGQSNGDHSMNFGFQPDKIRSGLESGIERLNRSLNEGGTAGQIRDQFRSLAQDQEFTGDEIKRWLAMIAGGFLALQSLRRSMGNLTLASIGAALFYWGFSGESPVSLLQRSSKTTHLDAEGRIRSGETQKMVNFAGQPRQVTKTMIVKGSAAELYKVWSNFENFPQFMQHIKSVRKTGDDLSHWVMEGPLGARIEWNAKTTRNEPNKRIGWSSIDGDIKTSGQVTFNSLPDNQTEVTVMLQYIPPAGMAGAAVAELFGNPESKLEEDLRNFKRFMEGRSA